MDLHWIFWGVLAVVSIYLRCLYEMSQNRKEGQKWRERSWEGAVVSKYTYEYDAGARTIQMRTGYARMART